MPHKKAHLFICVNANPDKPNTCGNRGSAQLHAKVKDLCNAEPWAKDVRINRSYCLGQCENGIAAVLYPQDHWCLNLNSNDSELLYEAVRNAVKAQPDQ